MRRIGVYIRRYVVLLAWYGALSVRWDTILDKRWTYIVREAKVDMDSYDEEDV